MPYPFVAAEVLTAANLNAMIGAPAQNAINDVTYTAVLLDAGKTVTLSNASAVTLTIPAQATVAWAANTQLNFLNLGVGTVTITPAVDVTINGTPLTLATSKGGSLVRTASNTWTFIPFSAGEGAANFTNTATGAFSSGGIDYKYLTLNADGSVTIDQAGFADILVVGGGGGGGTNNGAGGGAGGHLYVTSAYFAAATHTVTIGDGGLGQDTKAGLQGNGSRIGSFYALGGGAGGAQGTKATGIGLAGGSGGGGTGASVAGGVGMAGQGNPGGVGTNFGGGGGGGAGGAGATGTTGTGGVGLTNSITGSPVTRAAGGGGDVVNGNTTANGAANTGNGGGGKDSGILGTIGSTGGSGVVIVRVRTN